MIARVLVRGRRHASAAVSLGVVLGLAASWSSTQRQQQSGVLRANFAAASAKEAVNGANDTSTSADGSGEEGAEQHKGRGDKEPTLREDVIGSYEDRIRNFSSAERVFEFFASVTNDKGMFMTPADFARAITPYQHRKGVKVGSDNFKYNFQAKHQGPTAKELAGYKEVLRDIVADFRVTPKEVKAMLDARGKYHISAKAHLKVLEELGMTQEQLDAMEEAKGGLTRESFVAMVDVDGDGLISYEEYMLFRTLLAVPRRKLSIAFRMFDRDDSGAVDSHEFESFMRVLRGETNVGRTEGTRSHKRYYGEVANRMFFTDNGSGQLTLKQFTMFVKLLQREALVMQFNQWDERGHGALTATDFAKFLVTKLNADRGLFKEYLKRAESEAVAQLEVGISLEEFMAFHEVLQHLPEMEVAMKVSGSVEGRGLNRPEFVRAVQAALKGGRLRQQVGDPFLLKAIPARVRKRDMIRRLIFKTDSTADVSGRERMPKEDATAAAKAAVVANKTNQEGEDESEPEVLSAGVVDTLFALLDTDGDGRLDQTEFMKLMTRQSAVPDPQRSLGIVAFLKRLKECAEDTVF